MKKVEDEPSFTLSDVDELKLRVFEYKRSGTDAMEEEKKKKKQRRIGERRMLASSELAWISAQ